MTAERIKLNDAKDLIEQGANVADIRDQLSYQAGHIKGAKHIDNQSVQGFIDAIDKNAPLIVNCYHGNASISASQFFAEQGFTKVFSLDGGFEMFKLQYPELCQS